MKRGRKVLILVHPQFHPRHGRQAAATEYDVWKALRAIGDQVEVAAAEYSVGKFDRQLSRFRPDIVFNLLEEFRGEAVFDFHLISFLESMGVPYTGCNPRGLVVSRNKLWTSVLARGMGVNAPQCVLTGTGPGGLTLTEMKSDSMEFPVIAKLNREHSSLGLNQGNVVRDFIGLKRVLNRLTSQHRAEILVQGFVAGKEVSVAAWGNRRCEVLNPWCLHLPSEKHVASRRIKFDGRFRKARHIRSRRLRDPGLAIKLEREVRRLFTFLDMNGYARFDFRVTGEGTPYLIDVNANPCLARGEDFSRSAEFGPAPTVSIGEQTRGHRTYLDVIDHIVKLGLAYEPRV